jgi:predicted DNA repair protein MutK
MSGLFALLDDVAALVKLTASSLDDIAGATGRASVKAAGVVVDDTAVTPRYVQGLKPERELSIIWRIAKGSLRNKLLIILPVALILSQFAPWALTPILMVGGTYLCYEGAEKLWEKFSGHEAQAQDPDEAAAVDPAEHEKRVVSSATRTDFILSAEIMVIALDEVAEEGFVARAIILAIVAVLITALVYGVVGLIVKMDDAGLALARKPGRAVAAFGRGLVKAMPIVLSTLSWVGVVAMLWVGGHILLVGMDELGFHLLYDWVHHLEVAVHDSTGGLGAALGWITNTFFSAVLGLIVGAIVVAVLHLLPFGKKHDGHGDAAASTAGSAAAPHEGAVVKPGAATTPGAPAKPGAAAQDGPAPGTPPGRETGKADDPSET